MVGGEMNERIEKLISQSFTDEQGERFNAEKFAELIVKECDLYARRNWEHGNLLGGDLLNYFGIER
jgi:hypothetical protein